MPSCSYYNKLTNYAGKKKRSGIVFLEENMTGVKVQFEIGHEASIRTKKTQQGFTHDWEVFVRGQEGADISYFVEKVVFHLHETFTNPKRVVKEPPYSVKESGYAGFTLPIEIYLKNRDEPKKIKFHCDLELPQTGPATYKVLKDRYVFPNPNEDFKKKLLKGGGIIVSNNSFYTNPDQECRSRDSFSDEKHILGKPKLSSDSVKKHKLKEHKEETPHRTSSFENLFGPTLQKPQKISPDPKKIEKSVTNVKSEKKDKEKSSSDKQKSKHEHKEIKQEKVKIKDDKEKKKIEKSTKSHSKDSERSKEKAIKRASERAPTPEVIKKRCISPARRPPSPSPRSNSASSVKEEPKPIKANLEIIEQKKSNKTDEKPLDAKIDKDVKDKKKKEKKSHERDKERKEKKEHKKESHKIAKDSPKEISKELPKDIHKQRDTPKEKEISKEPQLKEKLQKPEKPFNKFSIENLQKTPQDANDRLEDPKIKEKNEPERKHKHKKKDKKKDESREKHKDSSKEKKHKHDKARDTVSDKVELMERRETPVPKEKPLPEPASPISLDTASQCSSKSGINKTSNTGPEDIPSSQSDSESSIAPEEDIEKAKLSNPSPELAKERVPTPEPEPVAEPAPQHKEKSKKHKDKSAKREEKRRKRKAAEEEEGESRKIPKTTDTPTVKSDSECGESSSTTVETKVQDNGVSSSLGEDGEPGDLSPDYMVQLRELQQRIMTIKSNEDLERVVNLIAETGRYEVTTQTFDFDLCLLDRSTVQQLIQLVGC